MVKMLIVWALALFFLADSLFVSFRSRPNTGTLLMWCTTALLLGYGLFSGPIDRFTASGFGLVLKLVLFCVLVLFVCLMVFLGLKGAPCTAKGDEVALIVLGAGLHHSDVSNILRRRLATALGVAKKNPKVLLVVSGGRGPGEEISEALAMKRWLLAQGLPAGQIAVEDKSTSTETNLVYSRQILQAHGIEASAPVAVVTNTFHAYRAQCYAKRIGFTKARSLPASMSAGTFLQNYMREALAFIHMLIFHTNKGY